jgi:hypothetical protein
MAREQEKKKERIEVQTKDNTQQKIHSKAQNMQWGALKGNPHNLGLKPITNSTKQVVQGDE